MPYSHILNSPCDGDAIAMYRSIDSVREKLSDDLPSGQDDKHGSAFFLCYKNFVAMNDRFGELEDIVSEHIGANFFTVFDKDKDLLREIKGVGFYFWVESQKHDEALIKLAHLWDQIQDTAEIKKAKRAFPLFDMDIKDDGDIKFEVFKLASGQASTGSNLHEDASVKLSNIKYNGTEEKAETSYFRISCSIDPFFELKDMTILGYRFRPKIIGMSCVDPVDYRTMCQIDCQERGRVDVQSILYGFKLYRDIPINKRKYSIIIPISYATLMMKNLANDLLNRIEEEAKIYGVKIIYEIKFMEGVPSFKIVEAVSMVKNRGTTLIGNIGKDYRHAKDFQGAGFTTFAVEYDGVGRNDMALNDYLMGISKVVRPVTGSVVLNGLDNFKQLAVARLAGISHSNLKSTQMHVASQ